MVKKLLSRVFLITIISLISLNFASAWFLNGTVYDSNGNALNNTNITITSIYAPGGTQPTFYSENTTQSNASGYFILNVVANSSRSYLISLKHRNETTDAVDFVGQSLPYFPNNLFVSNMSVNFYLKEAGTINITAINTTSSIGFNYQIKDSQLGYTIDSNWNSGGENGVTEANVYLPLGRNYSVMLYPRTQSIPLSYSWTNYSSQDSYSFGLSSYNATTKIVQKQFNTTMSMTRITGYINGSSLGIEGWESFTIIPMILESGKFVFLQHSAMPYNMSSWMGETDSYNYSSGFYNITIPGPAESQTILIYVSAMNNSNYYGSYKNISISYGTSNQENFTMYGLLGNSIRNISMGQGQGSTNIATKMMALNLVNSTNNEILTINPEAHVEVTLDYSSIGVSEIVITDSVSGNGTFYLPMLNISGTKEINIFSNNFAPKRVDKKTASQLTANNNISLSSFNPQTRDGRSGSQIDFIMLKSNSTCDVPNPAQSCYFATPGTAASFNPFSAVLGGGKISFRMSYQNVSVHYVNVDMLASGPPDASFDSNSTNSISSSFQAAMKFGSQGPKIYDYVLISMPYDEKILKEFQPVNISIPLLYDADWNVIWNVTANGTNPNSISGNYSHYSGKETEWGNLTQSKTCLRNSISSNAQINETNPCYIDTANNKIWIRIPHFSGTEPLVSGGSSSGRYTSENGVDYVSTTETSGTYLTRNYILINVTSNITNFNNLTVYLFNSTQALNLTNSSTDPTFWLNISNLAEGIWFFNVTAFNDTGAFNSTLTRNVTIDTTYPTIINGTLTETSGSTIARSNIYANFTSSDTNFANITINLYNSTSLVNSSSNASTSFAMNFTDLSDTDGIYYFNSTACDLALNCNSTSTRTIILNLTTPNLTAISSSVTSTSATITFNSSKFVNATVSYGTSSLSSSSSNSSYSTSGNFSLTSLSASTVYYYNLTICDRAGNCLTNGTFSFTTSANSTTTESTSSSSGSSNYFWTATLLPSDTQLNSGYNVALLARNRIRVIVGNETHYAGLISFTSTTATINVSSKPQQAVLTLGETKKFEVTNDTYYDISVTLNSIANSRANLTIKRINEAITVVQTPVQQTQTTTTTPTTATNETAKKTNNYTIAIIIASSIIILAAIIYFYFKYKKKRYYHKGY